MTVVSIGGGGGGGNPAYYAPIKAPTCCRYIKLNIHDFSLRNYQELDLYIAFLFRIYFYCVYIWFIAHHPFAKEIFDGSSKLVEIIP